jgi:nicotinamide mononucleotide adenylyltransferase
MSEITESLLKELLDEPITVAIYGGGFKPPTKGHFLVVEKALQEFPEIDELKIFVGGGVRDGITQDESIKVWEIYKPYLSDKIDIEASVAPVKSVLGYAKDHPEEKVYWILGAREGDEEDLKDIENRTKSLSKYPNIEVKIITTAGGVSGTKTRAAIKSGNKEQFFHLIPDVKEKEEIWNILSPVVKEELTEGRYDSLTRTVVNDILNDWKLQFDGENSDLEFEEDYEMTNSKGEPINFELYAVLRVKETSNHIYKVDGGADPLRDPAYLEVKFQVDPRDLPQKWEDIYMDLTDVVRHEIEHMTQQGTNVIPSKKMEDDEILRNLINLKLLPKSDYFRLEQEIDAMLQGMYLKAKKSKTPFKDVINDYFDKVKLSKKDRQDILSIWKNRAKALSLPLNEIGDASAKVYPFTSNKSLKQIMDKAIDFKNHDHIYPYYSDNILYTFDTEKARYLVEILIDMEIISNTNSANNPNEKSEPLFNTTSQVIFTTEGNPGDEITNLNEQYSVLSTITKIILEFVEEFNKKGGNITAVQIAPKSDNDNLSKIDSKRGKFYTAYIKKNLSKVPGYSIREKTNYEGHEYIEIYKTNSINELDKSNLKSISQKIDSLPQGKLFDDAKNIESIFNKSKHSWNETIESFEKNKDKGKEQYVNINDIHITQPNIQSNKVKNMIKNIDKLPVINVVEFPDGEKVIYDGHHRLIANWALGNEKIKANLVKIDKLKENDPFGIKAYARELVKETFKKDWNLKEGMLSLSKYMIDNGMNIKPLPKIKVIDNDAENASNLLGKTAYYNPADKSITLFTMNRHPKDILRSFAHEMVHHEQNLDGRLNNIATQNTNEDGDLPEIEREAYEKGNMMLRNWEDNIKNV